MKSRKYVVSRVAPIGALMALIMGASTLVAEPGPVATAWVEESGANITASESGDLTVTFPAQGVMTPRDTYDFIVGGTSPANAFSGDFSQYTGIRFRLAGDGHQPAGVKVTIRSTDIYTDSTRPWEHGDAKGSSVPYEWMINTIPLAHPLDATVWTPIWKYTAYRISPETNWEQDLSAVDMVVLSITPSDSGEEQTYSISQFQLVSKEGLTEAAQLTPIAACFKGATSIGDLTPDQLKQDSDGDGMSDVDEIAAGMDPLSSASVFAASIEVTGDGNIVKWHGVFGAHYAVLRSTDLNRGFEIIAPDVPTAVTGPKTYLDESPVDGEPNFYKVVKY